MPSIGPVNIIPAAQAPVASLMQIGNPAAANQQPGLISGNAPAVNTDPSAISGLNNQFASLISGGKTIKDVTAALASQQTASNSGNTDSTNTPTGDATLSPQTSGIAIPSMPMYIDQPIQNNVVLTKDMVSGASSAGKKYIFEGVDKEAKQLALKNSGNMTLANEVLNSQSARTAALKNQPQSGIASGDETESDTTAAMSATADTTGKINLGSLDQTDKLQDPAFAEAVNKIIGDAKGKTGSSTNSLIQPKVLSAKADSTDTAASTSGSSAQPLTANALNAKADKFDADLGKVSSKIASKVVDVKTDKIETSDNSTDDDALTAKLQNLDTQLSTKSFTQIKAAHEALAQSPTDQVQVRINQALASGLSNIKINLHPSELGSVSVDMDVDHEGNTKIRIVADKQDTLDLLKQNSADLTKSLSGSGVKADAGSLQFSLRGDSQNNNPFAQAQSGSGFGNSSGNQQQANAATATYSRFSNMSDQDIISTSYNKGLNIVV